MSMRTIPLLASSLLLSLVAAAQPASIAPRNTAVPAAPPLDQRLNDLALHVERVDAAVARAIARSLSTTTDTEPDPSTGKIPETVTSSLARELDAVERQALATAPERIQTLAPRIAALRARLAGLEVQRTNLGKFERERRAHTAPRAGSAPEGSGGAISGHVTDAAGGVPLAGVEIFVWDSTLDSLRVVSTGAAGNYFVGSLDPGTYFVHTDDAGFYRDELYDDLPCPYGDCNPAAGDPVVVTAGATTSGVDFALDRIGGITGLVTEEASGDPVPFGFVNIWDGSGFFVTGSSIDFTGAYAVGLEPGSYYVTLSPPDDYQGEIYDDLFCYGGFACDVTIGDDVQVVGTGVTSGIDFVLEAAGFISGTVTDMGTGDPLADVFVQIWNNAGDFLTTGFTDSSGEYTVGGLATGTHFATTVDHGLFGGELYDNLPCTSGDCDPTTGTPIAVVAGTTSADIDFALSEQTGIIGAVTMAGSGDPIPFIGLRVFDSDGSTVRFGGNDGMGDYAILLTPGTYFVTTRTFGAYLDELYDDIPCYGGFNCDVTSGTPVTVNAGAPTSGIDFALQPGASISGQVTDVASGAPIPSGGIQLYDETGSFIVSAFASTNGDFFAGGLSGGDYFALGFGSTFYRIELYDDIPCPYFNCNVLDGTPIAVTQGATTTGIDFELTELGGVIGTVSYAPPVNPLPFAAIDLYDSGGSFVTSSFIDSFGSYAIGLESGTYFALAYNFSGHRPELYQDIPCPDFLCDPTTGTPIVVTGTAVVPGIDFELDFELFSDGFESGDLSAWSTSVP